GGLRGRRNIAVTATDQGTYHPYCETSEWNDDCSARDASGNSRCDISTRFGRRPRLDRRSVVVDEREARLIEELLLPCLTCPDLAAHHLDLYRVSWQHVERVHWVRAVECGVHWCTHCVFEFSGTRRYARHNTRGIPENTPEIIRRE